MAGYFNVPAYNPTPIESSQNALLRGLEMQRAQHGNALQQMQMQAYVQQQEEAQRQRAAAAQQAAARNALLQGLRPVAPADAITAAGVRGPRPEALAAIGQRRKIDPAQALAAGFDPKTIEFLANADTLGMPEVARTVEGAGPDGRPQTQQRDKFGRLVGEAIPQAVKMQLENMGGQSVAVDPYGLKPGQQFQRTMTPGERDSSARGWAAERRQSAEAALPTFDAATGSWVNRKTQTVTPAAGPDGKPLASRKPATVEERNAAGYASRMVEAAKLLDQLEADGKPTYGTNAAGGLPWVGNAARTAAMSPVQQQYRQAQEDWVRAKLRKESGAAIGVDEMDREILTYFPQPGEAVGVVEQKRRARMIANEAMQRSAGVASYASDVPAAPAPRITTPANPNASAMQLFDAADAILKGGK